jgi:hypothetical protein
VFFDYANAGFQCRNFGFGRELRFFGRTAVANNCIQPQNTRITQARINHTNRTASFHVTATGATGFRCNLSRNGKLMFSHSFH